MVLLWSKNLHWLSVTVSLEGGASDSVWIVKITHRKTITTLLVDISLVSYIAISSWKPMMNIKKTLKVTQGHHRWCCSLNWSDVNVNNHVQHLLWHILICYFEGKYLEAVNCSIFMSTGAHSSPSQSNIHCQTPWEKWCAPFTRDLWCQYLI